jgi:hypothetical protein
MLGTMRGIAFGVLACAAVGVAVWLSVTGGREQFEPAAPPAAVDLGDAGVAARLDELARAVDELRQQVAALQQPRAAVPKETPASPPTGPTPLAEFSEQHRAVILEIAEAALDEQYFREHQQSVVQSNAQDLTARYGLERDALEEILSRTQREFIVLERKHKPNGRHPAPGSAERIAYDAARNRVWENQHAALSARFGDAIAAKIRYFLTHNWTFVEDAQR